MSERWFWKLSSVWDPLPKERYSRHEVEDSDALLNRVEKGRPWTRRRKLVLQSMRSQWLEDFPFIMVPLMSARAVEVLSDLLAKDGEFIPVDLRRSDRRLDAEYFLYNCLRQYDAVDRERTDPSHWKRPGVLKVEADLRLSYDRVPHHVDAFRCRQDPVRLLVSERIADRLQRSSLSGWMLVDPEDPPWRRHSIVSPHRPKR